MFSRRCLVNMFVLSAVFCGLMLPATSLAKSPKTKCDDDWLGKIALEQLRQTVADEGKSSQTAKKYSALSALMKKAIFARLACGGLNKFSSLNDMVFVLRACKYLPLVEGISKDKEANKKFALWLVENRAVSRRLFRGLEDVRFPDMTQEQLLGQWKHVLLNMHKLVSAEEKKVLEYPGLAVAFATSLPMIHYSPQPEPASMLESFLWYTDPKNKFFRYDLKKMPYEVSRYLAASRLNIKERKWAAKKYKRVKNLAKTFYDLKYDDDHLYKNAPKKISKVPYTLPNMYRVGGVCIEQAYYASEICRALGVPAIIVVGTGKSGIGHAWVADFKISRNGKKALWDSSIGRYEENAYFIGEVYNPTSNHKLLDCELMLTGSAAMLPIERKEQADAAMTIAVMVEKAMEQTTQADPAVLKKLAELYVQSDVIKKMYPGKRRAETKWVKAKRKIDLALLEDLLDVAIKQNLAHGPIWKFIITLCETDRLPEKDLGRFLDVLVTRTAQEYPDYSCQTIRRIVPTISNGPRRIKLYKKMTKIYRSRPDLQGEILIALGKDYQSMGKKKNALKAYNTAAMRCANLAQIVMKAAGSAEQIFLDANQPKLAIKMYTKLFRAAKKSDKIAAIEQTAHYQLGTRLAELLRNNGDTKTAEKIEAMIKPNTKSKK